MRPPRARPLLWPLVPVYWFGLRVREFGLRTGLEKTRRLRWPVISIGNLSAGGSGKTPLTIALARALTQRGVYVDVLSRGYGRRSAVPVLVELSGTAEAFGDEPLEIARAADVPVYVAAERYEAGLLAEGEMGQPLSSPPNSSFVSGHDFSRADRASKKTRTLAPEGRAPGVHLLDDGFQHRQLARDIDILLLSRADFADHLLPAGNLREALRAAARASVIAIPADEPELEAEIRPRGWRAEIWRLRRHMEVPHVDGLAAAFCGIARPEQFFVGLERAGVKLAARFAFRDHHSYTASDLARIDREAHNAGATALLTTEKDRVRLGVLTASLPIQGVSLRLEIEKENAAIDWLMSRVALRR
jgi:tetraacyldisaccharide 4'-kinase